MYGVGVPLLIGRNGPSVAVDGTVYNMER